MTETAKRVDEFTPDRKWIDPETGVEWLHVFSGGLYELTYQEYKKHPEVVEYEGKRWYKMSFDSDSGIICYKESCGRSYHERYAL